MYSLWTARVAQTSAYMKLKTFVNFLLFAYIDFKVKQMITKEIAFSWACIFGPKSCKWEEKFLSTRKNMAWEVWSELWWPPVSGLSQIHLPPESQYWLGGPIWPPEASGSAAKVLAGKLCWASDDFAPQIYLCSIEVHLLVSCWEWILE